MLWSRRGCLAVKRDIQRDMAVRRAKGVCCQESHGGPGWCWCLVPSAVDVGHRDDFLRTPVERDSHLGVYQKKDPRQ